MTSVKHRNVRKGCLKFSRLRADALRHVRLSCRPCRTRGDYRIDSERYLSLYAMSIEPPVGAFVVLICSDATLRCFASVKSTCKVNAPIRGQACLYCVFILPIHYLLFSICYLVERSR